jgi:8-oxo-dGTP diphosphatase
MGILLVRHAKAGDRGKWDGPDADRPLTKKGWAQASALAAVLPELNGGVSTVLSSPFVRCLQTVEPLAGAIGAEVIEDDRLAEGARFEDALELLDDLPDGAVVCSHGDVIPDVVHALVRRGMHVQGSPDWRKGSTWLLERADDGRFVQATAVAPPGAD